jgi:uncharacterized protein (DUF302 family)
MASKADRLRKAARKVATKTNAAIKDTAGKARRALRGRGKKRVASRVKEAIAASGGAALAGLALEQVGRARRSRRTAVGPAGMEVTLPVSLETAIERVGSVLKAEGFGILTRIDVHTTLRDKLGVSFRPYVILGACNPALAYRAVSARAEAGLLLPCNITVEETPAHGTLVRIADPEAMQRAMGEDTGLAEIARDAKDRLLRAGRALQEHAGAVVL